jgi:hypothetical protein
VQLADAALESGVFRFKVRAQPKRFFQLHLYVDRQNANESSRDQRIKASHVIKPGELLRRKLCSRASPERRRASSSEDVSKEPGEARWGDGSRITSETYITIDLFVAIVTVPSLLWVPRITRKKASVLRPSGQPNPVRLAPHFY